MDEVICRCQFASIIKHLHQLSLAVLSGVIAVEDVRPNISRKQNWLLLHYGYLLVVPFWIDCFHISIVVSDPSKLGSVELLDQ